MTVTTALNGNGKVTGTASVPDADAIIEHLNTLVGSSTLNAEPIAVQVRAAALFARLKALNRAANAESRAHKQATSDARTEMDQTHLGLQNLLYEKRHLEREIEKCKQFGSIYQDVPLCPVEDFSVNAPEELRGEDVMNDGHQLMLNRLSFELSERQRLEAKRKELIAKKEELLKQSKAKAAIMENVKVQVELLTKTANDVQKKVDDLVKPISTSAAAAKPAES